MPLSGLEKTLIKQIGMLANKLVKKKVLKKNIQRAVQRAFDRQAPELLALSLDKDFARELFSLAGGKTIDAENLVKMGEAVSKSKNLNLSRETIIKECKGIALKLSRIFEKIAPEYGQQVPAFEHFRDDLIKISTAEAAKKTKGKEIPKSTRFLFIVPHIQNFQLRHEDGWISKIEERLSDSKQAVIRQGVKLSGQGGIGKTAIAVEYAYRYSKKYPGGVFWLQIDRGMAGAARQLFLELKMAGQVSIQWEELPEPELVQALISFLNRQNFKLVILDNLTENILPKGVSQIQNAHILVTTRRQTLALPSVEMDIPDLNSAIDVFLSYAELDKEKLSRNDLSAAYEICKNSDCLPLALEILGKLSKGWPLNDLSKKLPSELIRENTPTCNKECTTVLATLNLAGNRYKQPLTVDVLKTTAYLAPDSLDAEVIASILGVKKNMVIEALASLVDISVTKRGTSSDYKIHRLTQEAARTLDENKDFGKKTASFFSDSIESASEKGDYQSAYSVIPHIIQIALMANKKQPEMEFPSVRVLSVFGTYLKDSGVYVDAEMLFRICYERVMISKGEQHPDFAYILHNLAGIIESRGRYGQAQSFYQKALEIRKRELGQENPDYASTLNNYAGLLVCQGQYKAAKLQYEKALKIRKKALGTDNPDYATTLNNLAGLFESAAKYDEALPLYKEALEIRKKALGPGHPYFATTLNNLAGLYRSQDNYDKSEELYIEAMEIREKALGPNHPDFATTLNNLAGLYRSMGRLAEAEPLYKSALVILERALGPEHPDVGTTLNNLAGLYISRKKPAEAEKLYKKDLEISKKALGPEHPYVATTLNNLAKLYVSQNKCAEAERLYKKALKLLEKRLGGKHPNANTVRKNLERLLAQKD